MRIPGTIRRATGRGAAILLLLCAAHASDAAAQTAGKTRAGTAAQAPARQPSNDARPDTVSTREMDRINWMEFRDHVPARINTVLLPTGTLEPHGVINNGADNTAPTAMARALARRVNAMIAPTLPYGMTGSLEAYPGAFQITESAYRPFVKQVLEGLAKNGFRNIVVLNGHGGPQTAVLNAVAAEVSAERKVRTLVVNWWSFASDITRQVFGEDGGHAGLNETAFIQAIDPTLVHPERYNADLATAYPAAGTWSAAPFPSSIGLYQPGQGYPKFDQKKADEYFQKVTDKVAALITDTVRKWDMAGL
ncbi:MAG TPA: creatininase family protein [Pyrinomonadaceae bacterium]|nr:creatininase family protein [Pyrinomonadaceae bacterium]